MIKHIGSYLTEWAAVFLTEANADSAYMRIKRFFRYFEVDGNVLGKFIFNLFGLGQGKWYLTLDRTNWQFGKNKINFLVLAVAYKGAAIPIMWTLLEKKGNSNSDERIALLERFINCLGTERIAGISADREFVGERWFKYLMKQKIPFYIRIKWNYLVSNSQGRLVNAWQLFSGLKKGEKRVLSGRRKVFGLEFNIAGLRCDDGGFLIIATTELADTAIEIYAYRWEIESLFASLKIRGFNMEDTHITHLDRLSKLMSILAIAFCWAHKIGEWKNEVKPIKIKKHGYKAMSLFHIGLNQLRRMLCVMAVSAQGMIKAIELLFAPPWGSKPNKIGVAL